MVCRAASLILLALLLLTLVPQGDPALAGPTNETVSTPNNLVPLPGGCGGVLPPGEPEPICCVSGYVFIDGQAVEGAKVTITNNRNGRSVETWTMAQGDDPLPYYRLSLSTYPLEVKPPQGSIPGDEITIAAEYSGHRHTITHRALEGGQHVDVVIPPTNVNALVFDTQTWRAADEGYFNFPSGVAVDKLERVYVVDTNNARVLVFDQQGELLLTWGELGSEPGQFSNPNGIAIDQYMHVYVADTGNHRIQKFTSTGLWLASWEGMGSTPGEFNAPLDVAIGVSGDLYVADTANDRLQRLAANGSWTVIGNGGLGLGQFDDPSGIAIGSDGTIYVADSANSRIQRRDPSGIWSILGGAGSDPGQFNYPRDVAIDNNGNLYVADTQGTRLQRRDFNGNWMVISNYGNTPGMVNFPRQIQVDSAGNLYVADTGNHRIQRRDLLGNWTSLGSFGRTPGLFYNPSAMEMDELGNMYVVDTFYDRIQWRNSIGAWTILGESGDAPGQFRNPESIALDQEGNLYIADTANNRIQWRDQAGNWTVWGRLGTGLGEFFQPRGLAVDADGNLYVADSVNNRIQQRDRSGRWTEIGFQGTGPGQFSFPHGVAVDANGNLYVADTGNNRIQRRNPNGSWTVWGETGSGPGQFNIPNNVSVDVKGNVYVADTGNNRIQRRNPNGIWNVLVGEDTGSRPGEFIGLSDVEVFGQDNIYVVDSGNNRIQVFRPLSSTRPIATIVKATPLPVVPGQPITLYGMGGDSDTTPAILAYEWTLDSSSLPFATTPTATLSANLTPGVHTITLRVRDTEGEWSDPRSTTITIPPPPTASKRWTFLLYLAGESPDLTDHLDINSPTGALKRLLTSIGNANVTVAALYDGPGPSGSMYYLFKPDGTLEQIPQGELNTGSAQTLIDFVRWGQQRAPADHYYLAIADHADALWGIGWDYTSGANEYLTNDELRYTLEAVTNNGVQPIDILHYDGCSMNTFEVAYQTRGLVRYLIASQNLGWSIFAYESYRAAVQPDTTPAALARTIVDAYAARAHSSGVPYTLAALDIGVIDTMALRLDELANALLTFAQTEPADPNGQSNAELLLALRRAAQKFDSSSGQNTAPDGRITNDDVYVDLNHYALLLERNVNDAPVKEAARKLRGALAPFVLHERHESGVLTAEDGQTFNVSLNNAHGISIHFPPQPGKEFYRKYAQGNLTLLAHTRWAEALSVLLADQPYDDAEPRPSPAGPGVLPPAHLYLPLVRR